MKYIALISLSILLAACTSSSEVQVTSDSSQEVYQDGQATTTSSSFEEEDLTTSTQSTASTDTSSSTTTQTDTNTQSTTTSTTTAPNTSTSTTNNESSTYSLQLVAGQTPGVVGKILNQIGTEGTPKWQYTKNLNGTTVYALLYGQYPTSDAAKAAIPNLPTVIQALNPFPINMHAIDASQLQAL